MRLTITLALVMLLIPAVCDAQTQLQRELDLERARQRDSEFVDCILTLWAPKNRIDAAKNEFLIGLIPFMDERDLLESRNICLKAKTKIDPIDEDEIRSQGGQISNQQAMAMAFRSDFGGIFLPEGTPHDFVVHTILSSRHPRDKKEALIWRYTNMTIEEKEQYKATNRTKGSMLTKLETFGFGRLRTEVEDDTILTLAEAEKSFDTRTQTSRDDTISFFFDKNVHRWVAVSEVMYKQKIPREHFRYPFVYSVLSSWPNDIYFLSGRYMTNKSSFGSESELYVCHVEYITDHRSVVYLYSRLSGGNDTFLNEYMKLHMEVIKDRIVERMGIERKHWN